MKPIPDCFKKCAITDCKTIEEFAHKYYKKERFIGRGAEYVKEVLKSHQEDLDVKGYTCISRHDNFTGEFISFIPKNVDL